MFIKSYSATVWSKEVKLKVALQERVFMNLNKVHVGKAAIAFGVVLFVVATGTLVFQVVGVLISLVLINHGLQLIGKPPLLELLQQYVNQAR